MKKKNLILIIAASVIVIGLVTVALYFLLNNKPTQDSIAEVAIDELVTSPTDNYAKPTEKGIFNGLFWRFNYPESGWTVVDFTEDGGLTVKTDDYQSEGPTTLAGAAIIINKLDFSEQYANIDEYIDSIEQSGFAKNVTTATVSNQSAYTFDCSVACRKNTVLSVNGSNYSVSLYSSDESSDATYVSFIDTLTAK